MTLVDDVNGVFGKDDPDRFHRPASKPAIPGEEGQNLGQHFFSGVDLAVRNQLVKTPRLFCVAIHRIDKRDPEKRAGENLTPHSFLFGTP